MSEIVIYNVINFKCQSLEYHENNIFFRKFRKRIKFLWKIKKSNIHQNDNHKEKNDKNNTKKYIQNAKKFNKISKKKKKNDTFVEKKE